jgi:hypothetical protein
MKITLQNYEEYFVRFIDNELSGDERAEVSLFLKQNPGLEAELDAFKATILAPDDSMVFFTEGNIEEGISLSNYDEYFIRLVEKELSADETASVTSFLEKAYGIETRA